MPSSHTLPIGMGSTKLWNRFSARRNRHVAKSSGTTPSTVPERQVRNENVSPGPPEFSREENNLLVSQSQSKTSVSTPRLTIGITAERRNFSSIWDEALRFLSEDDERSGLLEKYKKAMLSELVRCNIVAQGSGACDVTSDNIQQWLTSTNTEKTFGSRRRDFTGMAAKAVSSITQTLSAAGAVNPYIGLACAGLCILMVPLLNAAEQSESLIKGLTQISLITIRFKSIDQVLKPQPSDTLATQDIQLDLLSRIVQLFSCIIEYQAKAVCSFIDRQASFFRDIIQADDWAGLTEKINQMEMACSSLAKQIKDDRWESRFARQDRSSQRQLLDSLPRANAVFNSSSLQYKPTCQRETRVKLLQDIKNWSLSSHSPRIFWLKGLAGTGKSTIAKTLASILHNERRLAGSFFFARGQGDRGHGKMFFTTLAFQLSGQSDRLCYSISEAINDNRDIINANFNEQFRLLITKPLEECPFDEPRVVVIDALDECSGEEDIQQLLEVISQANDNIGMLRFFITSRPEIAMRFGFNEMAPRSFDDYALHDMDDEIVKQDITAYLAFELQKVGRKYLRSESDWPSQEELSQLATNAGKLFIYAATAVRFINQGGSSHFQERLTEILNDDSDGSEEIDKMYLQVLNHAILNLKAKEKVRFFERFQRILGTIVVFFRPLSVSGLSGLLSRSGQTSHANSDITDILLPFGSILDIPEHYDATVNILHTSFRDFLLSKTRCTIEEFRVSEEKIHTHLVGCCLDLMSEKLKKNVCNLGEPRALVGDLTQSQVNECLPAHVQYACQYWVSHLKKGEDATIRDNDQVHCFLKCHLLHWLEALSLLGRIPESIYMINDLLDMANPTNGTEISKFLHDAKRVIFTFGPIIELTPLQLYISTLVFTPKRSIVRTIFQKYIPDWILPMPNVDAEWNALLQTLEDHKEGVHSVAFSPNSKLLASASKDRTIKIWDAATGFLQHTLNGHEGPVNSVTFLPNRGQILLASGSGDGTVRIWNAVTGSLQQTLRADSSGCICSIAVSPDSNLLASSFNNNVNLWNITAGSLLYTLRGHEDDVNSVAFLHSPRLASGSGDDTVKVWDTENGTLLQTFEHDAVLSIASSHYPGLFASVSWDDGIPTVWDSTTGSLQRTFEGGESSLDSVAFSHDSALLAAGSTDTLVKVWDTATGSLRKTFEGHKDRVPSVTFSNDSKLLASGSWDGTAKIWDTTVSVQERFCGHTKYVRDVAFSPSSELLASGSSDNTAKVWDAASGSLLYTLEGHTGAIGSIAFSPNSRLLATALSDHTIRLWNIITGSLDKIFSGPSERLMSVSFSPDSLLISGSSHGTTIIWNITTGSPECTLTGHCGMFRSVAFSHDSRLLASSSTIGVSSTTSSYGLKVWDIKNASLRQEFKGHGFYLVDSLAFSHDLKLIASASRNDRDPGPIDIWEMATGCCRLTIANNSGIRIRSLSFDDTDSILHTVIGRLKIDRIDLPTVSGSSPEQEEGGEEGQKGNSQGWAIDQTWITWNSKKVLWLPPDYRPVQCDLSPSGTRFAFGGRNGRVLLLGFSSAPPGL